MFKLIDTHTHIVDDTYDVDRAEVIARAQAAGVYKIIGVTESVADAVKLLKLADQHPEILPALGLYPTILDHAQADLMEQLLRENAERLIGIGEVGLDYWKVKEEDDRKTQREIFARFIDLAIELNLPLNIHSRSAGAPVIEMLDERRVMLAQMHAFGGKASSAKPAVELGYYFSVPASLVYSRQKQKLFRRLPLECLLLETDSPVMPPVQGERNEPANVIVALEELSALKELPVETVHEAVIANSNRLYVQKLPSLCRMESI